MLGAAQTNGLGTQLARKLSVLRVIGISANTNYMTIAGVFANLICPSKNGLKIARELSRNQRYSSEYHNALCTINGNHVALVQHNVGAVNTDLLLGCINTERFNTAHARRTHTTCNNRCVARLTTMAGKNAFGCNHTLEVIRVGLPAHQYTRHALGGLGNGVIGREDNLANSSTGAGIQATSKYFYLSFGVKLRV